MKIKISDFCLKDTVLSGQAFRVFVEANGSFTIILKDRVVNIKQEDNYLFVDSDNYENLENIILEYFDLNRDYDYINEQICLKDNVMSDIVKECYGYKIMNQDSFEMCISYIISQNNNVKRISDSIEKLSLKYGKKVVFKNKVYYLFPSFDDLKNVKEEEFREFGVGFRDKYLVNFLNVIKNNNNFIDDINKLSTRDALKKLMSIKGIGLKVASCILLFGFRRFDVFPIDTWVKKTMSSLYNINDDQKAIERFAREYYGDYSGLAIQYMFHYMRNKNK